MRKIIATGLAAATLLGSLSIGGAASAQYRRHHDNDTGEAVAAGIAGLAVGAALAGSHPHYYNRGYYDRDGYYDNSYYGNGYYSGYGYDYGRRCRTTTVWDPYAYAYVRRTRCW